MWTTSSVSVGGTWSGLSTVPLVWRAPVDVVHGLGELLVFEQLCLSGTAVLFGDANVFTSVASVGTPSGPVQGSSPSLGFTNNFCCMLHKIICVITLSFHVWKSPPQHSTLHLKSINKLCFCSLLISWLNCSTCCKYLLCRSLY